MAPFTVRIYLTTLRTFFTMAVDDALYPSVTCLVMICYSF